MCKPCGRLVARIYAELMIIQSINHVVQSRHIVAESLSGLLDRLLSIRTLN